MSLSLLRARTLQTSYQHYDLYFVPLATPTSGDDSCFDRWALPFSSARKGGLHPFRYITFSLVLRESACMSILWLIEHSVDLAVDSDSLDRATADLPIVPDFFVIHSGGGLQRSDIVKDYL